MTVLKIACISDTHGNHSKLKLEPVDLILYAGDWTGWSGDDTNGFLEWLNSQDAKYKVFIAGNHDYSAFGKPQRFSTVVQIKYPGLIYLNNSHVNIEGLHIWGSPWTPWFYDWAFNFSRFDNSNGYEDAKRCWSQIPKQTNILLTHGPKYGMLDLNDQDGQCGCPELLKTMHNRDIRLHVFGHIHESHGHGVDNMCLEVNASILNHVERKLNPVIYVSYDTVSHQVLPIT